MQRYVKGIGSLLCAGLVLFALAAIAGCSSRDIAATFYDEKIYEDEVTDYTANFRTARHYTDDNIWAEYLAEQDLTTKTWRERVIGTMAEDRLIQRKAKELGIQPDQERVDEQVSQMKQSLGSDDAWKDYLSEMGQTEQEYRVSLEEASVEQQLYLHELSFDAQQNTDVINAYITKNLSDRVVNRYSALCYDSQEAAQTALDELKGLSGDELKSRFVQMTATDDSNETTVENGGDIGWDIAMYLGDVQESLNNELLTTGDLSQQVHQIDGRYYVLLCTDRYVFKSNISYEDIPDSELRQFVIDAVTVDKWQDMTTQYVSQLVENAGVQVKPMPKNLPYDVDDLIPQTEAYKAKH